jgi:hypothetical protein
MHFDADLVIDSSFGIVHDILVTVFGIPNPTLHMHAVFGEWTFTHPLDVRAFVLEGVFNGIKVILYYIHWVSSHSPIISCRV